MKSHVIPILLTLMILVGVSFAQTSNLTATIKDPDNQTWNNGTFTITFVPLPGLGGPYIWQGSPNFTRQFQGSMNSSGSLTASIPSSDFITPTGTKWDFTLCPNASFHCVDIITSVTGASPDLSSVLSAPLPAIRIPPGQNIFAYQDIEIGGVPAQPLTPGSSYWNVTSSVTRQWTGSAWQNIGLIGPGNLPTASAVGQIPVSIGAGSSYVAQSKLTIDARDISGIDCTGTNDTASAWNTWLGTVGDDVTVIVPVSCTMKVGSTITVSSRASFKLISYDRVQNGGGNQRPEFLWTGSTGGMWDFQANQAPTVEGFFFTNQSTAHLDYFLRFDGNPSARIGTEGMVRYNTFTNNMVNPTVGGAGVFDAITLNQVSGQNHEKYVFTDNDFFCSQSRTFTESNSTQITNGSNAVTCGLANCTYLTDANVGDRVRISYSTGLLDTTIASITDNNHLTTVANAVSTQSNARIQFRQAYGNGITIGSTNSKHNTLQRDSFTQCARGLNVINGSFSAEHFGGSANDVLAYIGNVAESSELAYLEDESALRDLFAGNVGAPLIVSHARNSLGIAGEFDGFLYFSSGGRFTITGSTLQDSPATNQVVMGTAAAGSQNLTMLYNTWGPGVANMANLGYTAWRTVAESSTVSGAVFISCGDFGIADAPGACFQFGDNGQALVEGNLIAGSARAGGSSFNVFTAEPNSQVPGFVNEARGFRTNFNMFNNSTLMTAVGFDAQYLAAVRGGNFVGYRAGLPTVNTTTMPFARGLWVQAPTANTQITTASGVYIEDLNSHTGITNRYSFFGAGATDIAHFGGSVEIGSSTFANLPTSQNGAVIYCSDCNSTCTAGGGTGRTCFRENGAWTH